MRAENETLKADLGRYEKPSMVENRPEWIWYCESTSGVPVVTFGRWPKHPQQARYKLAEIQPTEHDHPAAVADKGSERSRGEIEVTETMIDAAARVLNKRLAEGSGLHGVSRDIIEAALSASREE
ncbi:hypothetical protein CN138_08995 [Sinorhizobium meliloti]|uniref:hypothetical protein n=1 Tax=Rhizobium meliloti TaxID=382 RepID=UPI000FD49CF5|nr:hypothetical protein [Sinorhizobium meliloti]RVL48456.1 hypothetical protein CN145_23115 [Sinorhizobium meliloti]RVL72390.1 hypothetical protein CN138_08995 [Sinorhizobium meliloti]